MPILGPTKEFGAKIPQELYDEFREFFPMYGATTWFIESSLREFLAKVRSSETLQEQLREAVKQMMVERRESLNEGEV